MLIKWVSCTTTDPAAFTTAQAGWNALRDLPGFLGQAGGWSRPDPGRAQIVGCWRDRAAYQAFMSGAHDRIAAGQAGTYDTIQVRVFPAGQDIGRPLPSGFAEAALLRLAHCRVRPGHHPRFVRAQHTLWNPGMTAAPGFRSGAFAHDPPDDHLVLTAWQTVADHDAYARDRFPILHRRSGVTDDLAAIAGDQILLDPAWTVTGRAGAARGR
jgi:heme-degrading monooxygenase HmoA